MSQSYCVVYFDLDKTLFIRKTSELTPTDPEKDRSVGSQVKCSFPTADLDEYGREVVVEELYEGTIVFLAKGKYTSQLVPITF